MKKYEIVNSCTTLTAKCIHLQMMRRILSASASLMFEPSETYLKNNIMHIKRFCYKDKTVKNGNRLEDRTPFQQDYGRPTAKVQGFVQ